MQIVSMIRHGDEQQFTADTGDVLIFTNGIVTWASVPNGSDDFFELFNAYMDFENNPDY